MPTSIREVGVESRRCAEHGLSFLPGFWAMLFSVDASGELTLTWDCDLHLALMLGIQLGSPEVPMQR
jgi:hypothetical protein